MAYQRREYLLINIDNNTQILLNSTGSNNEPKNWENSEYNIKRSIKNFTETREYSKAFEFTGSGAAFLRNAYTLKDVEANVVMHEYRFNPDTDLRYIYAIGSFDFSKYKANKTTVSISFNTGGLNSIIKSKGKEKFELSRNTDINGNSISELKLNDFEVINRPLFLESSIKTKEDEEQGVFAMRFGNDYRYGFYPIPLELKYESDDSVGSVPNNVFSVIGARREVDEFGQYINNILSFDPLEDNRTQLFYYNSDRDKKLNITFEIDFYAKSLRNNNLEDNYTSIVLAVFDGAENPVLQLPDIPVNDFSNLENFYVLQDLTTLSNGVSQQVTFNQTIDLNLNKGQSVGLFLFGGGEFQQFAGAAVLEYYIRNINSSILIKENSLVSEIPRQSKFIFDNDAGERLMEIMTGEKGRYVSDFFTDGEFKLKGLTSGKHIRGFEDAVISTSLNEFISNSNALFNMAWNVEMINGKEVLRHEPLEYFFRPESVIKINNQVNNVSRSVATELIFSSITSGYKKPSGDNLYEEVQGLNEYNTSNDYITPITRIDKKLDITSPYRADSEGKELTLRQRITVNPTGDYRTDNNIFNIDLKEGVSNVYTERTWVDDFEDLPLNVFAPETSTGLRLTPYRNLKRNSFLFNSALVKFNSDFIRYSSTRGNSSLTTKKVGENNVSENGDYRIDSLVNPMFISQWIEFEYPVNYELINQVNGFQTVDGKKIPNTYFKVEFINEFNQKEYGYLFELKPLKEGKWKILKAF